VAAVAVQDALANGRIGDGLFFLLDALTNGEIPPLQKEKGEGFIFLSAK
jgi:hypothetical protein